MAHSSSNGHVGCIVWPRIVSSCKNPDLPSQYLMCPEVAISQWAHLWVGKSACNQPCEGSNGSLGHCGQESWVLVALWPMLWPWELSLNTSVWQSAVLVETRKSQVRVGADIPLVREESGCFVWVIQQSKVVGCCPGVQALTVRRCFVVTPVDMLAVEVTNIQGGVFEHRHGRWCESWAWRFTDVNDLASCAVYAQPLNLW